jgi:hypothetical protein
VEAGLEITRAVKLLPTGRVTGSLPGRAVSEPLFEPTSTLHRGLIIGGLKLVQE